MCSCAVEAPHRGGEMTMTCSCLQGTCAPIFHSHRRRVCCNVLQRERERGKTHLWLQRERKTDVQWWKNFMLHLAYTIQFTSVSHNINLSIASAIEKRPLESLAFATRSWRHRLRKVREPVPKLFSVIRWTNYPNQSGIWKSTESAKRNRRAAFAVAIPKSRSFKPARCLRWSSTVGWHTWSPCANWCHVTNMSHCCRIDPTPQTPH